MNFKLFMTAAVAASFLASCAKVSDKTIIEGTVVPEGLDSVQIMMGEQIDTLVPVVDGKFSIELPANICELATIQTGQYGANFISDGTKLTMTIDQIVTVKSNSPKISVQEKLNAYNADEEAFGKDFESNRSQIFSDESLSDEQKQDKFQEYYASFMEKYNARNKQAFEDNKDNILGAMVFDNLRYEMEDQEILDAMASMTPALQAHPYLQMIKKGLTARMDTAEGKQFTDFTVETVVGMTRSIPAQPMYKTVKFSDYVGNGKYVLVDFWSPWCGPCRHEMPNIKAVYDKYKGKKFDVLSIAVWEKAGPEVTLKVASDLNMTWNQINNAKDVPTSIYGIEGIPHIMLIGPDGTILRRGFQGEEIEKVVAEYVK